MSYRLINANALAMDYKEVNDTPCIYADLPNGLEKDGRGSRYSELFGTPESMASTLVYVLGCKDSRSWVSCEECPIFGGCKTRNGGYDALLEWLRGDAE